MDLLHDRIRHILGETGETASSLAKKVGCSPAAVQQWLSGETKNIKNDLLFAVADATGFEARWIGTGQGPEKKREDGRVKKLAEYFDNCDERGKSAIFRVAELESTYRVSPEEKQVSSG
jgi:transcriptional regulator with XRE-family HTH domain